MPEDLVSTFWKTYAAAEWDWAKRKDEMDEVAWIQAAGDALYDYSSLGTAPFETATPASYDGRTLFGYRTYAHPKLGTIHRLFASSEQAGIAEPARQFIATEQGGLNLMAELLTCHTCHGAGGDCGDCDGRGANPRQPGLGPFATLGTLEETVTLQDHPWLADAADW